MIKNFFYLFNEDEKTLYKNKKNKLMYSIEPLDSSSSTENPLNPNILSNLLNIPNNSQNIPNNPLNPNNL